MTSCWLSASWFSVVSGGHGKWALGGGEKPDIHFNPLWRRSLPGTICLFCLGLLFHPASSAEHCWTSSAEVLLHLWSVLSRLSYASHQHLDLYLISDPLPQLGPRWRGALCANTSQLVHISIFFLRQPQ